MRNHHYTDSAALSRKLTVYNRVSLHPGETAYEYYERVERRKYRILVGIVLGCAVVVLWGLAELYQAIRSAW